MAVKGDFNLFKWWASSELPQLTAMAFDILTIPAMSAETERVFSGAKLTISPTRNRLGEDIIEATECLNRWYEAGL
jgi:hAT family C-terminal dimerisation region